MWIGTLSGASKELHHIVNKKAILLQITTANKINIALNEDPNMESSNNIIALLQSSIT